MRDVWGNSKRGIYKGPQPGKRYEHLDGGTMYVVYRTPRMVAIKRKPSGNVTWHFLSTFEKMVARED